MIFYDAAYLTQLLLIIQTNNGTTKSVDTMLLRIFNILHAFATLTSSKSEVVRLQLIAIGNTQTIVESHSSD